MCDYASDVNIDFISESIQELWDLMAPQPIEIDHVNLKKIPGDVFEQNDILIDELIRDEASYDTPRN